MLFLTNTLNSRKELFVSQEPNVVKMYICGITPYDYSHIGHGRSYVTFDVLYRILQFLGNDVIYCRNFTDIDDKLLRRAEERFGNQMRYPEIADEYIALYNKEMALLGCMSPTYEPRVTEHIFDIIGFIEQLIKKGNAYYSHGDVYFHIDSFPAYGKLSKQKKDELQSGARIEISEYKRDPLDFVLWKGAEKGLFWESPWGYGRPGWHIECSVLAKKYLGSEIDIHGGGMDLIFPHHENEIAQSESLHGVSFAHYWIHNAFVRMHKEKMSKSLGNILTLQEVFGMYDPMVLRFYFLKHHYRSPLDFDDEGLQIAEKNYRRIIDHFAEIEPKKITLDALKIASLKRALDFLLDDLNTSGMIGVLFEEIMHKTHNEVVLSLFKSLLMDVCGLSLMSLSAKKVEETPEIRLLIEERNEARKNRDWHTADLIREKLKQLGVDIQDEKI